MTFNIYVASYNRAETTKVFQLVEYCTYVVRKSEAPRYKARGIQSIWAIDDELINSFAKVQNYIIENAPEDVVCVLDDDIENFRISMERNLPIKSIEQSTAELERIAQVLVDLDIGLAGVRIAPIPYGYHSEYDFSGMIGPVRWYNRRKIKSRYVQIPFFGDTDFVLQELLYNRIILRPNAFCAQAKIETNKGGMNTRRTKQIQSDTFNQYMKPKWGKYVSFDTVRNITKISVKR